MPRHDPFQLPPPRRPQHAGPRAYASYDFQGCLEIHLEALDARGNLVEAGRRIDCRALERGAQDIARHSASDLAKSYTEHVLVPLVTDAILAAQVGRNCGLLLRDSSMHDKIRDALTIARRAHRLSDDELVRILSSVPAASWDDGPAEACVLEGMLRDGATAGVA